MRAKARDAADSYGETAPITVMMNRVATFWAKRLYPNRREFRDNTSFVRAARNGQRADYMWGDRPLGKAAMVEVKAFKTGVYRTLEKDLVVRGARVDTGETGSGNREQLGLLLQQGHPIFVTSPMYEKTTGYTDLGVQFSPGYAAAVNASHFRETDAKAKSQKLKPNQGFVNALKVVESMGERRYWMSKDYGGADRYVAKPRHYAQVSLAHIFRAAQVRAVAVGGVPFLVGGSMEDMYRQLTTRRSVGMAFKQMFVPEEHRIRNKSSEIAIKGYINPNSKLHVPDYTPEQFKTAPAAEREQINAVHVLSGDVMRRLSRVALPKGLSVVHDTEPWQRSPRSGRLRRKTRAGNWQYKRR